MESIFEKRLTVTPDYCDASGALSPLAAFTIFQGIACLLYTSDAADE